MIVTISLPLADPRQRGDRLAKPFWSSLPRSKSPPFVRRFGAMRESRLWQGTLADETIYCNAKNVKFGKLSPFHYSDGTSSHKIDPIVLDRKLFFDGNYVARFDITFRAPQNAAGVISRKPELHAAWVRHLLGQTLFFENKDQSLLDAGPKIAELYERATSASASAGLICQSGQALVVASVVSPAQRRIQLKGKIETDTWEVTDGALTATCVRNTEFPNQYNPASSQWETKALRALRINLCRLHAEVFSLEVAGRALRPTARQAEADALKKLSSDKIEALTSIELSINQEAKLSTRSSNLLRAILSRHMGLARTYAAQIDREAGAIARRGSAKRDKFGFAAKVVGWIAGPVLGFLVLRFVTAKACQVGNDFACWLMPWLF